MFVECLVPDFQGNLDVGEAALTRRGRPARCCVESLERGVACRCSFEGGWGCCVQSVRKLACSGLDVFAHNIETVRRLTPFVRDRRASFDQSLFVLREAKRMKPGLFTKSSIMVGLGETREEVRQTLEALREHDVDAVTLGQYLRPSKAQLGIVRFVTPPEFEEFGEIAKGLGFKYVVSAPLSRSSYRAGEYFLKNLLRKERAKLQADVGGLRGSETEIAK